MSKVQYQESVRSIIGNIMTYRSYNSIAQLSDGIIPQLTDLWTIAMEKCEVIGVDQNNGEHFQLSERR